MNQESTSVARRLFMKDSGLMIAGGAIGGAMAVGKAVHGGTGTTPLRIAFAGCGTRARTLADTVLGLGPESVRLVGLADRQGAQTQAMYRSLKGRFANAIDANCQRLSGDGAFESLLQGDADLVYLATPPVYRPQQFRQAVKAGKHIFLEKPIAADVPGVLDCLQTAKLARTAGLSVQVGFQRRYDPRYRDTIGRIHEGAIGTPIFARAFCNAGPIRNLIQGTRESDQDFQIRNWNHYQWTGGDFLIEQHVAGLDVIRWALGQSPSVAQGQGGWGQIDPASTSAAVTRTGQVFDHHSIEYQFANGVVLLSQCRRVAKAWNNTSEHLHGTLGRADLSAGKLFSHDGSLIWQSGHAGSLQTATKTQQQALIDGIRHGDIDCQVESAAESTLFAMLGHQATRTGKRVRWERMLSEASQTNDAV
ncbi:Gfo/Idh/MocA family oxidoreductase [Stieleria sp. TO1_6]|uniref:Gfo/Idh/MocA family protein n=1 Tax=Stieleria tagensis TaxID=2956795 RepID=UPI00209AC782|nr:Gfo/Idh/MocA family oxidoreductase [Stieleria tagensis]MCO8123408.1 Gfo/Idh/MocA family oxidoreductase [Stieleria tagensis]